MQRSVRVFSVAVAALTSLTLTGCEDNLLLQDRPTTSSQVTPTAITPDPGCTISEAGKDPGQTEDLTTAPDNLKLSCDDRTLILAGDYTNKTANSFFPDHTAIKAAIVVDGEARIWHILGPQGEDEGCLTIQRLDETSASRDECDAERLNQWQHSDPAAETRDTPAAQIP
ncbi:hypothetical protein AVL61_16220 [Kocuria rosea subsp. polaris]|uniref:Lipoprotein n=1 Tax=Kocuria rosea subsp. polaris TaxID=136273 RepID=A0A0W8IRH9_KOCRO|nr:hypothetical protein [Kocuria polaris]KUG62288.1 hypothetical protein AVL61_16220 [Kocuria polaris]